MNRRKVTIFGAVGAAALVFGVWVFLEYFAPEAITMEDEAGPGAGAILLATGEWSGTDRVHQASGTVQLYREGDGHVLRFVDFDATSGPDVYLYLVEDAAASDRETIEDRGVRILMDGGADGGEATRRGTFNQALPAGVDPTAYAGLVLWCDAFDVLFGSAPLTITETA